MTVRRTIVAALERWTERCEAWEKVLDEKTAELQMKIDLWNKRVEEKSASPFPPSGASSPT